MRTRRLYTLSLLLATALSLLSCGEDRTYEYLEKTAENQWIFSKMSEEYLWADGLKSPERNEFFATPSKFFTSLLAKGDKTSFFSDTTATTSYGMKFALMRDPLGEKMSRYFALVLFVEPGSPAASAGLERGMWISSINGKALTASSGKQLTQGEALNVETQDIEFDDVESKYVWSAGKAFTLQPSTAITDRALLLDTVYNVRSNKVGYILCNNLNGSALADEFQTVALDFLAENVTDIVLDMRYCNGGSIENAAEIAAIFVPASLTETPFATLNGKEEEVYGYPAPLTNLSDKKLYIIIGNDTRGMAELFIASVNASRGMYEVLTIGERTAGSNLITREFESPFSFSINPAVAVMASSNGAELTAEGITPDYPLDELEEVEHIYPLGNEREYILRNVEYLIINGTMPQ